MIYDEWRADVAWLDEQAGMNARSRLSGIVNYRFWNVHPRIQIDMPDVTSPQLVRRGRFYELV